MRFHWFYTHCEINRPEHFFRVGRTLRQGLCTVLYSCHHMRITRRITAAKSVGDENFWSSGGAINRGSDVDTVPFGRAKLRGHCPDLKNASKGTVSTSEPMVEPLGRCEFTRHVIHVMSSGKSFVRGAPHPVLRREPL